MRHAVLSCYFTRKEDPQRVGVSYRKNNFDAIYPWMKSMALLGLQGFVFTDGLSRLPPVFEQTVTLVPYRLRKRWTIFEERHLCYLEFLKSNPQIKEVVFTDMTDAEFFRNPFPMIMKGKKKIFAGGGQFLDAPILGNRWMEEEMSVAYGKTVHPYSPVLCAGLWGCTREIAIDILSLMVKEFETINPTSHIDMSVFIKCVYDNFKRREILLGEPFASKFKAYEIAGNFCIRHK